MVDHAKHHHLALESALELDPSIRRPAHGACRVLDEIRHDALDEQRVATHAAGVLRDIDVDVDPRPAASNPLHRGSDQVVEMHDLARATSVPDSIRDMSRRFVISCSSRLVEARTSSRTSRTTSGSRRSRPSTSVTDAVIAATGLLSSCDAAARSERRMSSARRYSSASRRSASSRSPAHHQRHLVGEGAHHACLRRRERRPVPDEDQPPDRGPAHTQREVEAPRSRRRTSRARRPSRTRAARQRGPAPGPAPRRARRPARG